METSQQVRLLNNGQAASLLGITPNTLKVWRCKGRGPAFIKMGNSPQAAIAYDEADVRAFIESRKFSSTSAYGPAAQANVRSTVRQPEPVNR
jgi:hypothetical protein